MKKRRTGDSMDDLSAFLDDLASGAPVPGGGSAAALQVAMGAALIAMVCNLTLGRKRYAGVQDEIHLILAEVEEVRRAAHHLIAADAEAYAAVAGAMAMPRNGESERTARTEAIQTALKHAVDPPLACMDTALQTLRLAGRIVDIGNRNAISDVGVAALAAHAGYLSARLNVDINLASIADEAWVGARERDLASEDEARRLRSEVIDRVRALIGGTAS